MIITIHVPDMEPLTVQIPDVGDQYFKIADVFIHNNKGELLDRKHVVMNRVKFPHVIIGEFQEDVQSRVMPYKHRPTD